MLFPNWALQKLWLSKKKLLSFYFFAQKKKKRKEKFPLGLSLQLTDLSLYCVVKEFCCANPYYCLVLALKTVDFLYQSHKKRNIFSLPLSILSQVCTTGSSSCGTQSCWSPHPSGSCSTMSISGWWEEKRMMFIRLYIFCPIVFSSQEELLILLNIG